MKILILSKEAWRDEQNGGNVLSNLFANINAEYAQITCNEQEPNNTRCLHYYQMTDKMMVSNILHHSKVGRELHYDNPPSSVANPESYRNSSKKIGGELARLLRELVWHVGQWDKKDIIRFVQEFNPDIVFAPCYGNHYMLRLTHLVHQAAKVPIISYISDDFYSNKQIRFSPLFWINHFMLRKRIRETFKLYSLVYTMTDEQKELCEKCFGANMRILRKSGTFDKAYTKRNVSTPIRFVYAGGIYLNRWKTLGALASVMRKINSDGVKLILDIYTNSPLDNKMAAAINDGRTARVHKPVSMAELREIYHKSDVAIHAEAFDITNRHIVRMSFSTKIVDCLDSGCAVMAICDEQQAGYSYLKRNNAAICVSDLRQLEDTLLSIIVNPSVLIEYQHKAFELGRKNHLAEITDKIILDDFIQNSLQTRL